MSTEPNFVGGFYTSAAKTINVASCAEICSAFYEWMKDMDQATFVKMEADLDYQTMLVTNLQRTCYLRTRMRCYPDLAIPVWFGQLLVDYGLQSRMEMEADLIRAKRLIDYLLDKDGRRPTFYSAHTGSKSSSSLGSYQSTSTANLGSIAQA